MLVYVITLLLSQRKTFFPSSTSQGFLLQSYRTHPRVRHFDRLITIETLYSEHCLRGTSFRKTTHTRIMTYFTGVRVSYMSFKGPELSIVLYLSNSTLGGLAALALVVHRNLAIGRYSTVDGTSLETFLCGTLPPSIRIELRPQAKTMTSRLVLLSPTALHATVGSGVFQSSSW